MPGQNYPVHVHGEKKHRLAKQVLVDHGRQGPLTRTLMEQGVGSEAALPLDRL